MNVRILSTLLGAVLLLTTTSVMSESKICITDSELEELVSLSMGEKLNEEGMMLMSKEELLKFGEEYHQATVDKWQENGIIFTNAEKLNELIDEEVAKALAEHDYSVSDNDVWVPIEIQNQQFYAFCAGRLRYEGVHLYENQKGVLTEDKLRERCKQSGY